jgi:hypothetical protein
MQNAYTQKETLILRKIYELSGQNTTKVIGFHELVPAVEMTDRDVTGICKGLAEQGYIEWPAEGLVTITRKGIHAIDSLGQPKERGGGDTYNTNIHNLQGGAQFGPGNTQNIQVNQTNNPEFDQAISGLLQLIQASGLPKDEIEELQGEVERLSKLALSEPKPGLFEKAKARLDFIKLGLQGTEVLIKAGPLLLTALEHFSK